MRHLVVGCDGTWNSAAENRDGVPTPTNVRLFHNALAPTDGRGHEQVTRYFSGVGADGAPWTRAFDGGTGHGLSANIRNAYSWLASTYRGPGHDPDGGDGDGDRIAAVGFSRGAFTARSLVGMLTRCGLLDFSDTARWGDPAARQAAVARVFEQGYAHPDTDAPVPGWDDGLDFHPGFGPADTDVPRGSRIEFVGVWDTVGALGVPDSMAVLDLLDDPRRWRFHHTELADEVGVARHAIALDERRGPFAPTLWTRGPGDPRTPPNDRRLRQLWFPGAHSDVGGGYREHGLSDGALVWMIEEARDAVGLGFRREALAQLRPWAGDVLHDSCVGVYERISSTPRAVPRVDSDPTVHASARHRAAVSPVRQDPYRRTDSPVAGGGAVRCEVLAREPWSDTGIFLEPGTYRFRAEGDWVDRRTPAGPGGVVDRPGVLDPLHLLADLGGRAEAWWHRLRHGDAAQFVGTRRVESMRWMELVGVVANGAGASLPSGDDRADPAAPAEPTWGGPDGHQYVRIGEGVADVVVVAPGYLYAFANDAWGMYANNRGSVRLTVASTTAG